MKRRFALILAILALALTACGSTNEPTPVLDTADAVIAHLTERNAAYVAAGRAAGDVSQEKRTDTAEDGQQPYAVVITCSDSRIPPEHIFAAGIGESEIMQELVAEHGVKVVGAFYDIESGLVEFLEEE